jgi:hypothetical protein
VHRWLRGGPGGNVLRWSSKRANPRFFHTVVAQLVTRRVSGQLRTRRSWPLNWGYGGERYWDRTSGLFGVN